MKSEKTKRLAGMRVEKIKSVFLGIISSALGSALIFSIIIMMNQPVKKAEKKKYTELGALAVKHEKKKEKKVETVEKVVKKNIKTGAKLAPMPGFSSSFSGASFGLKFEGSSDFLSAADEKKLIGETSKSLVMTEDSVDKPPRPLSRTAIEYPQKARAKGVTGFVLFNLLINESGVVEKAQILESSPPGTFDEAAESSIKSWRFEPASYKGSVVKVWAKQKISFNLN